MLKASQHILPNVSCILAPNFLPNPASRLEVLPLGAALLMHDKPASIVACRKQVVRLLVACWPIHIKELQLNSAAGRSSRGVIF